MIRPACPFAFEVEPSHDGGFLVVARAANDDDRVVLSQCDTEDEAIDVSATLQRAAAGML